MSNYYQHRISECIITEEKILIKVKIPLKKINPQYELFKFHSVPQGFNGKTCCLLIDEINLAIPTTGDEIIPISGDARRFCETSTGHGSNLCYLPIRPKQVTFSSNCAELIYKGAPMSELLGVCSYRCLPDKQTIITQVNHETFVITNPLSNITIICGKEIIKIPEATLEEPGSLEIQLKCACELHMQGRLVISENFPCSHSTGENNVSVTHILPALWSNFPNFRISAAKNHLNSLLLNQFNLSFNPEWMQSVSHLDITPPKPINDVNLNKKEESNDIYNFMINACYIMLILVMGIFILKIIMFTYRIFKSQILERGDDEESDY